MIARSAPRRWSDELGGIRWLPRLIDKAKMDSGGALGAYLFGHSPIDRGLLTRLGLTTAEFASIVAASPDDAAVLAALRSRGFDEARVQRWSARLPQPYQVFIRIIDVDDGYVSPSPFVRLFLKGFRTVEDGLMAFVRRLLRAP
jgi:Domain of unknown function (DUF5069)